MRLHRRRVAGRARQLRLARASLEHTPNKISQATSLELCAYGLAPFRISEWALKRSDHQLSDTLSSAELGASALISICARVVHVLAHGGTIIHEIRFIPQPDRYVATVDCSSEWADATPGSSVAAHDELKEYLAGKVAENFVRWCDWRAVEYEGMEHFDACILDDPGREYVRSRLLRLCDAGDYTSVQDGWSECWRTSTEWTKSHWQEILSLARTLKKLRIMMPSDILYWHQHIARQGC